MNSSPIKSSFIRKLWPESLYGRLAVVWLAALLIGHMIQNIYGYLSLYDDQVGRTDYYLAKDLALLLPQLEESSPDQQKQWIKQMERQGYSYILNPTQTPLLKANPKDRATKTLTHILRELDSAYEPRLHAPLVEREAYRIHIQLHQGAQLAIVVNKTLWPIHWALGAIFFIQVFAVIFLTWFAVKQATRSLGRLAEAAEKLGSALDCQPIPEDGPKEVARAASAFNAMQTQIKNHLAERVHILASISHDLQTPITRMRLRAELLEDESQQQKWLADLTAMQLLVEEGITYARSSQTTNEVICKVDVDALIHSIVYDYLDTGHAMRVEGELGKVIHTRPHALKRILTNLIDNALKFAEDIEIRVTQPELNKITIAILDRGPGIPENELAAVMQPFYRLENSRNRQTGGTGLGLAIAQQLAHALQGSISLRNREGGGLEAIVEFPETLSA